MLKDVPILRTISKFFKISKYPKILKMNCQLGIIQAAFQTSNKNSFFSVKEYIHYLKTFPSKMSN